MPTHKAYTEHNNNSLHILMIFPKEKVSGTRGNMRSVIKKIKKINKIQAEIKKLDSILHSKSPSVKLKDLNYNMPYNNTAYLDETIIHWLRGLPEILEEILD